MDTVPNTFPSLFFAYTIVWGLMAWMVWSSFHRLRRLERELRALGDLSGRDNKQHRCCSDSGTSQCSGD